MNSAVRFMGKTITGSSREASPKSMNISKPYSVDGSGAAVVDTLFTLGCLYFANQIRTADWIPFVKLDGHSTPLWLYPVVCLIWLVVFSYQGIYDRITPSEISAKTIRITKSVLMATLFLAGALYFSYRGLSRGYFLIFLTLNIVALVGWRYIFRILKATLPSGVLGRTGLGAKDIRRVLIVGANSNGTEIRNKLLEGKFESIEIVGTVDDAVQNSETDILGTLEQVRELVLAHKVDDVIVALSTTEYSKISKIVLSLEDLPVLIRVIPDYFSLAMYKTQADEFGGVTLINLRAPAISSVQRLFKRLFDILVSSTLIFILSPVYVITAIAIRLESAGPALFFQERIGENGKRFKMIKFRSMVVNAESLQASVNQTTADGAVIHKVKNDSRVTKIGRFIRSKSIDELPQLFNVLLGDMSLVGPRPELPWLVDQYDRLQRRRFAVPQGITGWWQVNGRSDKPMHLNTDDDLYYIKNYSIWLDFLILLKTPLTVLSGKGAF